MAVITALRERPRADRFVNDVRGRPAKNASRWIYMALILGFFLWLGNVLIGSELWLRADGLVDARRVIVASAYECQVLDVKVAPGAHVAKGTLLAVGNSPQVIDSLALLKSRYAETYARQAELSVGVEVAQQLGQYAAERGRSAESSFQVIKELRRPGIVSEATWTAAQRERYTAKEEQVTREAGRRSAEEQLRNLRSVQQDSLTAMNALEASYHGGLIEAPEEGIVGANVATRGAVLKPGDELMEIFTGERTVLAYLDTGTFYKVELGERVSISDGYRSGGGTVTEILPIAVLLPPEFQNVFHPAGRGQVARISLDEPQLFPLQSKVKVTGQNYIPGEAWLAGNVWQRLRQMLAAL